MTTILNDAVRATADRLTEEVQDWQRALHDAERERDNALAQLAYEQANRRQWQTQYQAEHQLEVTCKTGADEFKKHFLGLSDNTTYFVEQIEGKNVSTDFYKVTFKPTQILPQFENTSGN